MTLPTLGPVVDEDVEEDSIAMVTDGTSAVRLASFLKRASQVRRRQE